MFDITEMQTFHSFDKTWLQPTIMWSIRILFVIGFVVAVVLYWKYIRKEK